MTYRIDTAVAGPHHDALQAPKWDYANGQKITANGSSQQTTAINSTLVRVYATADVLIKVGASPTAADSAGSIVIEAGLTYHETIEYGHKIAIIEKEGGGDVYILPAALVSA